LDDRVDGATINVEQIEAVTTAVIDPARVHEEA
jgi:hypothetical protein